MLVLQILTAALTISFAKANPVVVDVRNWEALTTNGDFKRGELVAASPASHYKRATCIAKYLWQHASLS